MYASTRSKYTPYENVQAHRSEDPRDRRGARCAGFPATNSISEIDRLQVEIDDRCFTLLALHQPMAVDLRSIVAAVKIDSDLERVGDRTTNIAEDVISIVAARDVRHVVAAREVTS